jgi:hypothetical protein
MGSRVGRFHKIANTAVISTFTSVMFSDHAANRPYRAPRQNSILSAFPTRHSPPPSGNIGRYLRQCVGWR